MGIFFVISTKNQVTQIEGLKMEVELKEYSFEGTRYDDGYDESFCHDCDKTDCKFRKEWGCDCLEVEIVLKESKLLCLSFESKN